MDWIGNVYLLIMKQRERLSPGTLRRDSARRWQCLVRRFHDEVETLLKWNLQSGRLDFTSASAQLGELDLPFFHFL